MASTADRPPVGQDVSLSDQLTVRRGGTEAVTPEQGASQRLGAFELVRPLGSGGMGQVFEAIDRRNGQRVALKMLYEVDPAGVYRLKREFRRMADISHENLISLYELHNEGTCWFFTMELLAGTDLKTAMLAALADGLDGLRPLLRQFVRGIHALHRAGRIHRDLKPSNVMVTPEGRVVILDFGLVNEIDHRTLFASSRGLVRGTPAYMAPEQAAGQLATPAADWYAVGAIVFDLLAGRYPFVGGVMEILVDKQYGEAPRLSSLVAGVPPELDDLVAALLHRVPSERPGATELLAWCAESGANTSLRMLRKPGLQGGLLQREPQLSTLRRALRRVLTDGPICVDIVGDAGTGKTALVQQFIGELVDTEVVVFESVCSQREVVPFRAFDGLLDAITAHLLQLPTRECEALLNHITCDLHALAQLFPVLARVPRIAQQTPPPMSDPGATRRRAFDSLKALLFRLAEHRLTVVFLDNLQWGDLDSARLLDHLLTSPGIPPCLFVASYRRDERSPLLRDLALQRAMITPAYASYVIETAPLSPAAAVELARRLLGGSPGPKDDRLAQRSAREADGNPALIHALVDEALRPDGDLELSLGGESDLLRRLVRARLSRITNEAREVFGRIVASSTPLPLSLLWRSGVWEGDVLAPVAQLRGQGLVRSVGDADGQCVAPISEPIQQAAQAVLEPELLRRSHRDLATALLVTGSEEPERIARHLYAAGLAEQAFEHISSAARQATRALAFDRAAELYRFALQCKKGNWSLLKNCAQALLQAGRGTEAAPLLLAAAEAAPPPAAARLRCEAAEQFFVHGFLERGAEILAPLLRAARIDLPKQGRELNAQLTAYTDRVLRRGYTFEERGEIALSRRELERIDVCWVAGKGLLLNEPPRAGVFLAQCVHLAVELGEPRRVARALALFGVAHGSRNLSEGEGMVAEALRLGERMQDDYTIGLATICRGILTRFAGRWLAALTDLDFGVQHLREHCPGSLWESGLGQGSTMTALEALGELRTMAERTEILLRDAQVSGDAHTGLLAAMYSALTLIAAGRPAQARARVRDALAHWPRQGFYVEHLHALRIEVFCDLYERRPGDAWQRILAAWPALESSDLLRVSVRRTETLMLRARASLAALRASPAEYGHLRDVIDQDLAQLEREGRGYLGAEAALLRAGLAACAGAEPDVGRLLNVALVDFEAAGRQIYAACVRRLRGALAGQSGATLVAQADALLRMQNIKEPAAWLRIVAPGLATP